MYLLIWNARLLTQRKMSLSSDRGTDRKADSPTDKQTGRRTDERTNKQRTAKSGSWESDKGRDHIRLHHGVVVNY